MFLHLIALPDEISKLRMKCTLSIRELQIRHEIKADWSNDDGGRGWSAGKYPLDLLREYVSSSNAKKITPAVECETLAIFDENAAAVTLNKRWQTFIVPAKVSNITHLYGWNPEKSVMDGVCEENAKCLQQFDFASLSRTLVDLTGGLDVLRHQTNVTAGIFVVNFWITIFMFIVLVLLICCGCY